ncbi:MAG: hypothetical protein JWQ59_991 [Cryobacterium sp.]|nr:hypothetical protein [Cryobacterium sp.]
MKLGAAPALFREEQGAAVPGRSKSVATCSLGHEYPNGLPWCRQPEWSRGRDVSGAAYQNRTDDLFITSESLYRLS